MSPSLQDYKGHGKSFSPSIREPFPFRRKVYLLPLPDKSPEKPQKIDWLRTLLPPLIMVVVLSVFASAVGSAGFFVFAIVMMVVYPLSRLIAFGVQTKIYNDKEKKRADEYAVELEKADRQMTRYVADQRRLLKAEFAPTEEVCRIALAQGDNRRLWYRTNTALDFLALRLGVADGKPTFPIGIPKGDDVDPKDELLKEAKKLKEKYAIVPDLPFLLNFKGAGSVAIMGGDKQRYGVAHRLLLDVLVHHRPDEVEIYVLSTHKKAGSLWSWLRWAPHLKVLSEETELPHLVFGSQAVRIFLARFENQLANNPSTVHQLLVIDVDGIQQYDDVFITSLIATATEKNISLLFVGGSQLPRNVRQVVKLSDQGCEVVDTLVTEKDPEDKEYHIAVELDDLPDVATCEKVARALAGVSLLTSAGDALLSPNTSLFDVLRVTKDDNLTFDTVLTTWGADQDGHFREFEDSELLQFPVGLIEESADIVPYELNLLESGMGGKDAFHTILIGATGSGKSEFIKSLILGAAYKYPPQILNFFCMDFKGGSTVDQLKVLPHVVGVMTNLDEVLAQRGLIAINYEIDRRQGIFNKTGAKDIWQYNKGKSVADRIPHLVLVLDEFTRGLDMLSSPEYNLQDLLEKRLVPQGRSVGIYLILANQVANAKSLKLLPNIGWRIALRVASSDQMNFIASGLKPVKFAGRGYIQAIGESPVEFQSGYSGRYVRYSNLQIKTRNIVVKELLDDGSIRDLTQMEELQENDAEKLSAYLEMNQIVDSIKVVKEKLNLPQPQTIYLDPLPRDIEYGVFSWNPYREYRGSVWSSVQNKSSFLRIPVGKVDLVKKCQQKSLILDFSKTNPHLLLVGSQMDILDGLRTVLFSLCLSHSPDDVNIYMLEFGKGIRDLPSYPHIGQVATQDDPERIFRTIEFFENEFAKREMLFRDADESIVNSWPRLFLVVNNIAGLKDDLNLYPRIFQFILQESHKYGIHLIVMALPRGTGTKVPSGDLKAIKSRLVFPSISADDYWHFLEMTERKLVKLTGMDQQDDSVELNAARQISRAHWMCVNDPEFDIPVELQLAQPVKDGINDAILVSNILSASIQPSPRIRILESTYQFKDYVYEDDAEIGVGIKWSDLQTFSLGFESLPNTWGVSGPPKSGKTNFMIGLLRQLELNKKVEQIEVFSAFPNPLTDIVSLETKKSNAFYGQEQIYARLKDLEDNLAKKDAKNWHVHLFDDLHVFWERDAGVNKEIQGLLTNIWSSFYRNKNVMAIASFNYSQQLKVAKTRDGFVQAIHDNKTGLCLAYEGDWLVSANDITNYRKKIRGVPVPGRGVFSLSGHETEVQTFLFGD